VIRTPIIYFHRIPPEHRLRVILAARDAHFDRLKTPMHKVRWVRASVRAGYWTT